MIFYAAGIRFRTLFYYFMQSGVLHANTHLNTKRRNLAQHPDFACIFRRICVFALLYSGRRYGKIYTHGVAAAPLASCRAHPRQIAAREIPQDIFAGDEATACEKYQAEKGVSIHEKDYLQKYL